MLESLRCTVVKDNITYRYTTVTEENFRRRTKEIHWVHPDNYRYTEGTVSKPPTPPLRLNSSEKVLDNT